jgi:branched-chain amino acid transport system substrate-binding protein
MTESSRAASSPPIKPYKIGVMIDIPHRPVLPGLFLEGLEYAFDEALETGFLDRPVETVLREYHGQPEGESHVNVDVYRELVEEQHVLGVAGPMTTDNCLAVLPEVLRQGVPAVTICGTQLWVGRPAFNLSNGGMGDEPAVMASWLRNQGHSRIAVLKDSPSQIGEEYTEYFRYAAALEGLSIILETPISPVAPQELVSEAVASLQQADPDAVVYLGLGGQITPRLNPAFEALDWWPTRITTAAFVTATFVPERAHMLEGWYGIDQYDERNEVLRRVLGGFEVKHGRQPPAGSGLASGYDVGRVLSLGLSRMRLATAEALRDALETIRRLPAANGAPGTVITFGPEDHRGYKGADYLVIRHAKGGTTELVGTAPVA